MKKKVALSATAIAVLASAVPAQVAPVEAAELKDVVYTKFTSGNDTYAGNGTEGNPYNLFQQAIENVADGGTIIISGKAFLNDITENGLPFYINKKVTIKSAEGQHASLDVRTPGIILGNDVKFENISLEFASGYHDAIYANGHRLDLINVTKPTSTREIDLFAGGLYNNQGSVYPSGNHGIINVEVDNTLSGNPLDSKFGNIYAGSMNGNFDGTADITVTRKDSSKKLVVGDIYGSGALESDYNPDNWFDMSEPAPPQAMPNNFKMNGNVKVTLNDYQATVDGNTGSTAVTSLKSVARNLTTISAMNIKNLELEGAEFKVSYNIFSKGLNQLTLGSDAILDLSNYEGEGDFNIGTYTGTGGIALPSSDSTVNITNDVTSENSLTVYLKNYNKYTGYNGTETLNQPYVTTPNNDARVTFFGAENLNKKYNFLAVGNSGRYQWMVADPTKLPSAPEEEEEENGLPTLTDISTDEDTLVLDMNDFSEDQLPSKTFLFNVYTQPESEEVWFGDYKPTVTVNGKQATLVDDDGEISYTADDLSFYFQPNYESDDLTSQQMVVQFNGEPTQETYEFVISADGVEPLTLTLNVEGLESAPESGDGEDGGELPPDEPDNTIPVLEAITSEQPAKSISMNSFEETVVPSVEFPFNMKTDKPLSSMTRFDQFNPTVKVDGKEAVKQVVEDDFVTYRVEGLDMTIYFELGDDLSDYNSQKMMVLFDDENGQPSPPTKKNYQFEISTEEVEPLQLTLTVEDLGTEEPDPVPPGEDGEDPDKPVPPVGGEDPDPEQPPTPGNGDGDGEGSGDGDLDPEPPAPTKPTIQQFTKGSYLYEGPPASELSIPFEVEFDTKPSQPVPFHEIEGTKVVFSGEEFEYRDGRYYNDSHILVLEIRTGDEVGKYTAVLKNVFGTNETPSGTHSFTLQASDKQAVLDYTVRHIINNLTADVKEKTFKANDFSSSEDPKVYFTFEAETNNEHKELSWYEGFSLTINGKTADTFTKDGRVYYRVYNENDYVYIDYEEATGNYKLVLLTHDDDGNPAPPKGNKYTIALSYKEGAEPLTFTANVQGEGEPTIPTPPPVVDPDPVDPTPPPVVEPDPELPTPDTTEVTYTLPEGQANQEETVTKNAGMLSSPDFFITPQFVPTTPKVNSFLNGLTVTIGGHRAERVGEEYLWVAEGVDVTLGIGPNGDDGYQVSFNPVKPSDGSILDDGQYTATIQYGDSNPVATFKLNVESEQVTPTPPPVDPTPPAGGDKEEEKEEPTIPPSGGSGNNGGSTTPSQPSGGTVTPSQPSTGGGTTLPTPDPKPEKPVEKPPVVDKPTPIPPKQEETKPTTRPTVKPDAVASKPEALEKLPAKIQEKVDSLMTEVIEQAKGLVLDLTGDKDDLSSVSTLEVTNEGVFANVDGERVKFASDLKLNDMSKLRITRTDGSPIPYKTDGTGFTITTHNFSDILITERVVEPFVDVAKDDWFQPYVDEMYNRGITTGTTATSFSPNASITRAQLAALLARTYELKPTGEKPVLTDTADQWYSADVQALVDLGIIKGYGDGTFRGDEPITREHLVIMLQRLAEKLGKDANHVKESNFTDTAKMSAEGKSAIQWAAEQGIINSGQGTAFKPKSDATRAQVAKMLTLFINK